MDERRQRYVQLLVAHGLNVQSGQLVNIATEPYHRDLALAVAEEAYRRGARYVMIDLQDPRLQRTRVLYSGADSLSYMPPFVEQKFRFLVDDTAANLRIIGPEDPEVLVGLDPGKINTTRLASYQAARYFYEEGIGRSKVHWSIAAAATPAWAKRIFPDHSPAEAERLLWEELYRICRVDREDFMEQWHRHNELLHRRAAWLTGLGIKKLRFRGPGTDLTVRLSPASVFRGGGDLSPRGVEFEPNIPTEENYTTPDWRGTEGRVRTTRPFLINGTLIQGLELEFRNGEIVSFSAREGESTFREYISSDPGAKRLGEVALVGTDSPIFQSGLVFEEILLDENAACHIAIGSAYKFCVKGGETMTSAELAAVGCNESTVHTDMMISSESVDVEAEVGEGQRLTLMERGRWVVSPS